MPCSALSGWRLERRPVRPWRRRLSTWLPRLALLAALLLHLVIVRSLLVQPLDVNRGPANERSLIWSLHNDTTHRRGPAVDFFAMYHAGIKSSRGTTPYEKREDPKVTPYFYPYRYLPFASQTLGRATILLPPEAAYRTWIIVLETILATLIALFWRAARARWLRYFSACGLLLSSPYFLELHVGQFTFATLALVSVVLLRLDSSSSVAEKASLVLVYASSVLLKMFPVVLVPMLIRRRVGVAAASMAILAVLLFSYPYFRDHPAAWRQFYTVNFAQPLYGMDSGNFSSLYLVFLALKELGTHWTADAWGLVASCVQWSVLGATGLVVLCSRCTRATVQGPTLLLAYLVSFSQVWEHHASGEVVIALVLLGSLVPGGRGKASGSEHGGRIQIGLALASIILLAAPTPFWLIDPVPDPRVWDPSAGWSAYARFLLPLSKAGPTLLLFGIGLHQLIRAGWRVPALGSHRRITGLEPQTAPGLPPRPDRMPASP